MVFLDESGFLLQPLRRDTWAPIGQVPVRHAWARHDRLSAICALTVAPWAKRFGLYYDFLDGNFHATDVLRFVQAVHQHLRRRLVLVWDRWQVHRSVAKQLGDSGCDWLRVSWLPGYAPELDPVEFVWNQAKYVDLVNWIPNNISEVRYRLTHVFDQYRHDPFRLSSFLRAAHLSL